MQWGGILRLLECVQLCSAFGFWGFAEVALVMTKHACVIKPLLMDATNQIEFYAKDLYLCQDLYVTKIVTVWLVTDTEQLLNGCQMVKSKIG